MIIINKTPLQDQTQIAEGIVRIRELPPEIDSEEAFLELWKKLKEAERDRYTKAELHNVVTTAGLLAINQFLGANGTSTGFAKYLALGIGSISAPRASDTSLVIEWYRKQPSLSTIIGNVTDVSTFFSSAEAQFVITECGLFGGNATSTPGSGILHTHLVANYNNQNSTPLAWDYQIIRN